MEALNKPSRVQIKAAGGAIQSTAPSLHARNDRIAELTGLAVIFFQLLLIAWIIRVTGLEALAFRRVIYIAVAGFVVHHLLPFRFRLPFFAALSLGAIVLTLGGTIDSRYPDLAQGLVRTGTILAVGSLLIGICHLPLGFWIRAALLLLVGAAMAAFRGALLGNGDLAIIWPVLAAMFMFRVMVYLYDVSTSPRPPTKSQSLAYFFLFPNLCALLFPVIDFRTFCQKYYDEDPLAIYQRGAQWMTRGVVHLLLYRVIDRLVMIEPSSVANGTDVIQFVVGNLFLYLKVSGGFHLVIGMLLLFGFNLPETNHRYFLASSFTDYWRRVNIYWRNFIMKVFYYPAFFRFKKLGQVRALILATLWSFLITWALHLYQTWWVTGSISWSWPDTLFWTALALLVLGNSIWELKRNRQRKLVTGRYSVREALGVATRTAATFAVIAVLWSLWSTPTLAEWVRIWSLADRHTFGFGLGVLGCVMVATILFEVLPAWRRQPASSSSLPYLQSARFRRDALLCAAPLLALYCVTHPRLRSWLDGADSLKVADATAVVRLVSEREGATRDQARGYYENLTSTDDGSGQYFETMHPGQGLRYSQPTQPVEGVHFSELIPNTDFEHHGWRFQTNRWGMRDRDYELEKSRGVIRVALLGSSQVMGFGLTEAEMFEPVIEDRLNAAAGERSRLEVLNFALGGMSPLGQIWLLQARVPRFHPDVILFVAHPNDFEWSKRDIARMLRKRIALPSGVPLAILSQARVRSSTPELFAVERLRPFEAEILSSLYRQIVQECRTLEAKPVYIFLPVPTDLPLDPEKTSTQLRLAEEAGFLVIDLSGVYSGHETADLILKDQGRHINAFGHALIAEALYQHLSTDPRLNLINRMSGASEGASPNSSASIL